MFYRVGFEMRFELVRVVEESLRSFRLRMLIAVMLEHVVQIDQVLLGEESGLRPTISWVLHV